MCPVREHIYVLSSPNFCALHSLPMTVARASSGSVATRYVLPVLWMTSYLHILGRMKACRYRRSERSHCVVVRRLTSLLRCIDRVVSETISGAETRRVYRADGDGFGACNVGPTIALSYMLHAAAVHVRREWLCPLLEALRYVMYFLFCG